MAGPLTRPAEPVDLLRPVEHDGKPPRPVPCGLVVWDVDDRESAEVLVPLDSRGIGEDWLAVGGPHAAQSRRPVEPAVGEAQDADDLLAEALHNLTFDALAKRAPLRVAFEDGSECPPLSIGGFLDPGFTAERWTGVRPLRVSLMSMRHLDQDAFVDMAWFRNADLSRERRAAEIEALAYRTSRDLFGELVSRRGLVVLEVFHTGFKPALIGFYRALGDVLFEQRGRLCVQPMYHRSSRPELGTPWF